MKHTELPWIAVKDKDLIYIDSEVFNVCDLYHVNAKGVHQKENAEANAAFIVNAVNNHENILKVLRRIETGMSSHSKELDKFGVIAAIKQAEES